MNNEIEDLHGYCDDGKISLSESRRNLFTVTNVSWMKFLTDNFTTEELMQGAAAKRKLESVKSTEFLTERIGPFFEPVLDTPLPNSFKERDEDK